LLLVIGLKTRMMN